MEKYAVEEQASAQDEKYAAEGCPKCGKKPERHGGLLVCPKCGSEPFEGPPKK